MVSLSITQVCLASLFGLIHFAPVTKVVFFLLPAASFFFFFQLPRNLGEDKNGYLLSPLGNKKINSIISSIHFGKLSKLKNTVNSLLNSMNF